MGTAIGPVFTYLLTQLPAVVQAVDANGIVTDGYPIVYPPSGSPLVGVGAESPLIETSSGTGARAYVDLGGQNVDEDFNVPCYVAVATGGNDQSVSRNAAIATYDAVCHLIASDMTLGGALLTGRWAEIGPLTLTQTPPPAGGTSATGRWCVISFAIHATNHYRP